jgi:hydroxymethylbilane synthase
MRLRIATRGSTLALIQAQLVADLLAQRYPEHEFVLQPLTTHGDRHPAMPLTDSAREGVFVKELEKAVLDGRAELAVHSAKDLPTAETPGLALVAFPARADARDGLISRSQATLMELAAGSRVGTGSPRRAAQVAAARPDLKTEPIRGNVDTRLRRLQEGAVDALILAAAGLERLGRLDEAHQLLPFDIMLPAPGQGALAVQALEGSEAARLAAAINDEPTARAVRAERALLRRLGGGCLSALGAYASIAGGKLEMQAVVLDATGQRVVRASASGANDGEVIAEVARIFEERGAAELLANANRDLLPVAPPSPHGALKGIRVMVTRANGQADTLADALRAQGAAVTLCPVIEIEPIPVSRATLAQIDRYDWLILTSVNGVDRLFSLLAAADLRFPTHIKVAVIGPQSASRLRQRGVDPSLVPRRYVAEELADELIPLLEPGDRVLLARAAGSREVLPQRLRAAGAKVDVIETYRAVPPADLRQQLSKTLPSTDIVTFTSSSTVRHFLEAGGAALLGGALVACIGPITAATVTEAGLRVDIIAAEYTATGLVEAIVASRAPVSA